MAQSQSRRCFLSHAAGGLAAGLFFSGRPFAADDSARSAPAVVWHDVREWGVEGKGFADTEKFFDRLPARAKGKVRDAVWSLSRHSAGMLTRFRTNATAISVDYTVTSDRLGMPHMPATGVSGIDLYADDEDGNTRWVSVTKPTDRRTKGVIISGLAPGERTYTAYLPLYNGTESVLIGVPEGATFEPLVPRQEKPLLFYGTSITHGASASRPGMPHPAILGRRFKRPVLNLGFSGNGKMEPEVGAFLAELDPAVYVIDCLPNMVEAEVAARAEALIRQLRTARPETPIVMVEDRTYSNTWIIPEKQARHAGSRKVFRAAYDRLTEAGFGKLFYLEGEGLLGTDRDDTTDGSHPSDLGFMRHADAFEPVLRSALA